MEAAADGLGIQDALNMTTGRPGVARALSTGWGGAGMIVMMLRGVRGGKGFV